MTGGSLSNRLLGLSLGRLKDNDDCDPLKNRLLEVGETLVKCKNKENKLINELDNFRNELSILEQKDNELKKITEKYGQ